MKNIAQRFPVYALLPETPKGCQTVCKSTPEALASGAACAPGGGGGTLALWQQCSRSVSLLSPNTQHPTPSTQPLPLPDKPSIVVLPFVNMSNDPEQDYFSDGITEDITGDLSKISSLFVIARNSAFTYKGKAVKVQDVSREMGVRYVLEGSVQKAGQTGADHSAVDRCHHRLSPVVRALRPPTQGHLCPAR